MIILPGRANVIVVIEKRTITETGTGLSETWAEISRKWAEIQTISTKAILEYRKAKINAKYRLFFREAHGINNPDDYRIKIGEKYYQPAEILERVLLISEVN